MATATSTTTSTTSNFNNTTIATTTTTTTTTIYTTLQLQLHLQLHHTTPHYIQQLWMRWLTPGLSIGVPTSELLRSYFLVKSWFWLVNKPVLAGQISMRSPVSGLKPATVWFRSHVYPIFNRQPPGSLSKEPSPKSFDCTWLHCSPTRKRKDLNTFKLYGAILLHVFQDSWSKQIFNQPFEVSKPVPQVSPRRLEPA